jgi:hypothetical protein
MEEIKTELMLEYIGKQRRQNGREYVNRMDGRRIAKQILQYAPGGRKCSGRPAKRWLATVTDHVVSRMFGS